MGRAQGRLGCKQVRYDDCNAWICWLGLKERSVQRKRWKRRLEPQYVPMGNLAQMSMAACRVGNGGRLETLGKEKLLGKKTAACRTLGSMGIKRESYRKGL